MTGAPEIRPEVLREYALLADGERGALIGPHGDIVWMCAPRWDSDAVFSALIGGSGAYVVGPNDHWYVWGGYYEPSSLIWHSRWMTAAGAIECREALAFPGDTRTAVVLRRIHAHDNCPAEMHVALDPRAGFGRHTMHELHRDGDTWTARVGPLYMRWSGAPAADERDGGLTGILTVPAGQTHDLVLELSDQPLPTRAIAASDAWEATEHSWKRSMPELTTVIGTRDAHHACAVLRGMTSSHGGMAAAATTSLPERAEAGRNYDYRYSWIRDQCYAGQALAVAGMPDILDTAVDFISQRILDDGPSLRPAYTVDGASIPEEYTLRNVIGYPGGGNRAGNNVGRQFQLDAFGESLLLFSAAARDDRVGTEHWRAVEAAVAAIEQRVDDEGTGVWELHNERWSHSRLICAAGLYAVAANGAAMSQAGRWTALADSIVADVAKDCLHPSGRWQRAPSDPGVDAALLLPVIRGGIAADDPRSIATLDGVRTELSQDGYVYRFRHDQRPLYESEGAFLLCGFITALAEHQQGNETRARALFERHRAACGPAGLFSEEYDVNQRQLRGNLPQAFVHALMLEAACRLARPWTAP